MNILEEVHELVHGLGIRLETGVFKSEAPDTYIVLVPLEDAFPLNADNMPLTDVQEVRITLFSKGNRIIRNLLSRDICVTRRRYNGYDTGAGNHQYTIDVAKNYELED